MSSLTVETSAGEQLIYVRPFDAAEWWAWLVSKMFPRFTGSLSSYTKPATKIPYHCSRLRTDSTKINTRVKKSSFPILKEEDKKVQECMHMVRC